MVGVWTGSKSWTAILGTQLPVADWQFDYNCTWCSSMRLHVVLRAWDTTDDPEETFESRPVRRKGTRFILAECSRCEAPLLLAWQPNVEEFWHATQDDMEWQQLWPPPKQGMVVPHGCPPAAAQLLNEAMACQDVSPTAAVVLTRKAVETITASLGFRGNLGSSLRKMREQGVIDERLWAWSDLLRKVGNKGAHDLEGTISIADAGDATWFGGELIHQVFVVQPRFDGFARRHPRSADSGLRLVKPGPRAGQRPSG